MKALCVVAPAPAVLLGVVGHAHATTYYVDTSEIPAGEIRSNDGYCSLAEAIASANAGASQYDCTGSGSHTSQTIVLRQAAGKSFSAYPYNIGALAINSPGRFVSIQSQSGRAQIRFTSNSTNTNAFDVYTSAELVSVDMTHSGGNRGRLLFVRASAGVDVFDSTLSGGNVTGLSDPYGGAVHNLGMLNLGFGTQLTNNAAGLGGAIYNRDGAIGVNEATLEGNTATKAGGGIYNISTSTPGQRGIAYISGTGLRLRFNSAPAGGGLFNRGSQVVLHDPEIRFNTASGSDSQETCHSGTSCDGNGAGALNINTSNGIGAYFETTRADIFGNSASGRGGGVYVGGEVTLYNPTIAWNDALTGGALYVIEDTPSRYCEVRTRDGGTATIEYNQATAGWGYSIIDGDGLAGTPGAHCKVYNPKDEGIFVTRGHANPKCEPDRAIEDGTNLCSGDGTELTGSFTTYYQNNQGYCGEVVFTNTTGSVITDWSATFDLNGTMIDPNNYWNIDTSGFTGTVTVSPKYSWGMVVQPGASIYSHGFCAIRPQGNLALPSTPIVTPIF
jgi:hypothetical protein